MEIREWKAGKERTKKTASFRSKIQKTFIYIYIYIRRCSYEAERFSLKFTFEEQRGGQERERDGKFRISEFFLDREV